MARRQVNKEHLYNNIDMTGVYAYADVSHVRDRALWRGFLSCILPLIFQKHNDIIDKIIDDSLVDTVEDLAAKGDFSNDQGHAMRSISTHIAKSIGVSPEFALASFYNCEYAGTMPTKLYKFHYKPVKKQTRILQEENMINTWLANFEKVRKDKQFLDFMDVWKGKLN